MRPSSPFVMAFQAPRLSAADRHPRPSAARAAPNSHSQHSTRARRLTSPRSAGRNVSTPPAPCVPRGASRRRAVAAQPSGTSPSCSRTQLWRPSVERADCASGSGTILTTSVHGRKKPSYHGKAPTKEYFSVPATRAEAAESYSLSRPTSLLPTSWLGSTVR